MCMDMCVDMYVDMCIELCRYWLRCEQYVLQFRAQYAGSTLQLNYTMAAQSNGDNAEQSKPGKVLLSAASLTIVD